MSDFFWFSDAQWARIGPLLPTDTRGMARVDDRRVLSGIVHALRNGGRWADCPREVYGPKKTLYNRFVRWANARHLADELARSVPLFHIVHPHIHPPRGDGKGGPWPIVSAAPRGAATPLSMRQAGPSILLLQGRPALSCRPRRVADIGHRPAKECAGGGSTAVIPTARSNTIRTLQAAFRRSSGAVLPSRTGAV